MQVAGAMSSDTELNWYVDRVDGAMPRMFTVQSSGCAPVVKAFEEGKEAVDRARVYAFFRRKIKIAFFALLAYLALL